MSADTVNEELAFNKLTLDQIAVGDELPPLSHQVSATTVVLGALASRDWRPMHHDRDFAINRNGVKDIFINTPNNAHWFERYITDWTGPTGRLGRMKFKMSSSVFPGDEMVLSGKVENVGTDSTGCGWADLTVIVSVDGEVSTQCQARIAIPVDENDNPWDRKGDQWQP
jgi:acyl dehydratase